MNIHVDPGQIPEFYPFESRVLSLLEIRKQASDEVERLLAIMEEIDADPDLEPSLGGFIGDTEDLEGEDGCCGESDLEEIGDLEPSLGWSDMEAAYGRYAANPRREFDLEDDDDDREVDPAESGIGDAEGLTEQLTGEPSLGSLDSAMNQTAAWKMYSSAFILDAEADHCGREPEDDLCVGEDEPQFSSVKNLVRNLSIDPGLLPPLYSMRVDGDCLEPLVRDGERVIFDQGLPCRPGDLVGLFFRKDVVPPGGHQMLLKRLVIDGRDGSFRLMNGPSAVMVEMFNPPRTLIYPTDIIIAMHRCTGTKGAADIGPMMSEGDLMAAAAQALQKRSLRR